MNFNKSLVAMALFVSTGAAHAGVYGTSGDMFLNVIDVTKNTAYSLDLGTTAAQIIASPSLNLTINNTDGNFSSFMTGAGATDSFVFQLEGQQTAHALVATTSGTPTYNQNSAGVAALGIAAGTIGSEIGQYYSANVTGAPTGMSVYETSLTDATFGSTNAASLPASTTSPTGTAISLLNIFNTTTTKWSSTLLTTADFTLTGTGSNAVGALTVGNVQPVPLPAAVWMFLTGLIGVFSSKRRKAV